MMDEKERRAHLASLQTTIATAWRDIEKELDYRIENLTRNMILTENVKLAGRIKELDDLKKLPERIADEISRLDNALPLSDEETIRLDG